MPLTRSDFQPYISPMEETLKQVKATLRQHLEIVDWEGVDIILAAAVAHNISPEMLWLRFIGPSRSGKTELLRAIVEHPDCAEMEVLTPAAFRGGFRRGPKILKRINQKLVITKDIASILTSRKDMRTETFGILRSIKDGKLTADFGSDEGHLEQPTSYDWILATTSSGIEQQRQLEGLLGQRFIDLRWVPGNREEMAFRAAENNPYLKDIRANLLVDVSSLVYRAAQEAKTQDWPSSDDELRWIAKVADTTATLRTPVQRDRQSNIVIMPEPEVGTELAQGFSRIARGFKCLDIDDWEPYISRIVWDCMSSIRIALLRCLSSGPKTVNDIEQATRIPSRTIYYHKGELELLGIVEDFSGAIDLLINLP